MSKYNALWAYIQKSDKPQLTLTFNEISQIAGVPIDHSFLSYKKKLSDYGYEVVKISMKAQTVLFPSCQRHERKSFPSNYSSLQMTLWQLSTYAM